MAHPPRAGERWPDAAARAMLADMTATPPGTRGYVRSADLLPPPPLQRPLLHGALVAAAGAAVWGAVVYFAHIEAGLLAWGIGVAIGAAMVRAGAHGTALAVAAGLLALLAIVTGKQIAFRLVIGKELDKAMAAVDDSMLHAHERAAAAWVALGDSPTAEQVRRFAREHDYELGKVDEFVRTEGARLRWIATTRPDAAAWRADMRERAQAELSFVDYLKDDFHPADILFALFGIASAFGLVSKATTQRRVAARHALRAEADVPSAPSAADGGASGGGGAGTA
jgi:hypothetical protein